MYTAMKTTMSYRYQYRHEYVVGDLQGCYAAFSELLEHIEFDPTQDKLWLAGDVIARGEDSLSTLRLVKKLQEAGAAEMVLGNHDINLIAVWRGFGKCKKKDKTQAIMDAADCDALLNWLRRQPVMAFPSADSVMVHAGIPPHWSINQAKGYAEELQVQLSSNLKQLDRLLPNLYSKVADVWTADIQGYARIRSICNYFTRMRLCDANGTLEFSFKAGLHDSMPNSFRPWFEWQVPRERRIFFGHWAALEAHIDLPHAKAVDGGCVWGHKLIAHRLEDNQTFFVYG